VTLPDQTHDPGQRADDPSPTANLLPPVLGLIGIALACAVWALGLIGNLSGDGFSHCAGMADDAARLACYDQLDTPHPPARGALAPLRIYPPEEIK
jgi:hypothetical protein